MSRILAFTVVMLWASNLPCSVTQLADDDHCSLKAYRTANLTIPNSWILQEPSFCLDVMGYSAQCSYMISFCKGMMNLPAPCTGASVCQIGQSNGSTEAQMFNLGGFDKNIDTFVAVDEEYGFKAMFRQGQMIFDEISKKNRSVQVEIHFYCNENMPWVASADQSDPTNIPSKMKKVIWHNDTFMYEIRVEYRGACIEIKPIAPSEGPTVSPPDYISPGTILIIIAACCMTLYCTIGCAVKASKGNRGTDMIPNNETWANMPTYTQDGCRYVFSCACCHARPRVAAASSASTFKGYDSI